MLPRLDDDTLECVAVAARDCVDAADAGDVTAELEANRRLHSALLDAPETDTHHVPYPMLWDSTEAYRATYYNSPEERQRAVEAHGRIVETIERRDADALVPELDGHPATELWRC